jgi:hypothetical protein
MVLDCVQASRATLDMAGPDYISRINGTCYVFIVTIMLLTHTQESLKDRRRIGGH